MDCKADRVCILRECVSQTTGTVTTEKTSGAVNNAASGLAGVVAVTAMAAAAICLP